MPITRATNLAGLGTIFDSLTDGGGLSISGISTFTDLNITRVNITGVGTISSGSITNLTGTSSTITTFASTNGSITNLTGTSSTITTFRSTTGNFTTGNIVTGVTTNFTSTNATITNLTGTSSTITTLRSTTGNFTTGNIVTGVTTNFNTANVIITGVTTVSAGTNALPSISPSGDSNTGIFFPSADTIAFSEGGAEAVRIDSSGRLLVGTSTNSGPNALVEVAVGGQNAAQFGRYTNSSTAVHISLSKSRSDTKGAHTVVQNNDGMGVIQFYGSDGTNFLAGAEIKGEIDGTPGANDMPGRLVFSTTADGGSSPTERMRIASDGHTYWGVANPGTTAFGTAIGRAGSLGFFQTARNINGTGEVGFFHGNAGEVRIYGDGDLENTNNSYGALSDLKLKENIVDAASQWNDLKALQVRKYNLKQETGFNTHTQIGLVAQEVELVSPGLVGESPDRDAEGNDLGTVTKSVNYSVLYMKAVKALQEAMERIEQLETSNADLLARVIALEAN